MKFFLTLFFVFCVLFTIANAQTMVSEDDFSFLMKSNETEFFQIVVYDGSSEGLGDLDIYLIEEEVDVVENITVKNHISYAKMINVTVRSPSHVGIYRQSFLIDEEIINLKVSVQKDFIVDTLYFFDQEIEVGEKSYSTNLPMMLFFLIIFLAIIYKIIKKVKKTKVGIFE